MSIENIKAFNAKVETDENLKKQLKAAAGDANKYIALAKENGFEISTAALDAYKEELKSEGKLRDEDLDNVSGGGITFKSLSI